MIVCDSVRDLSVGLFSAASAGQSLSSSGFRVEGPGFRGLGVWAFREGHSLGFRVPLKGAPKKGLGFSHKGIHKGLGV